MADDQGLEFVAQSFSGDQEYPYPIHMCELEFIRQRRRIMGQPEIPNNDNSKPTTQNNLVGLCLSGGGIRSATFNLGFIQALFRRGVLQRVDYLSTVSGGGYIGSCLTALLSSSYGGEGQKQSELWDKDNFPFSKPKRKCDKKIDESESCPDTEHIEKSAESAAAEKQPVRHLRYFSNYITAEGSIIQKYFGPLMVFVRGLLLNFLLIIPYLMLGAVVLALILSFPQKKIGEYPFYLSMDQLKSGLESHGEAEHAYEAYVINSTRNLPDISLEERMKYIRADKVLAYKEIKLRANVDYYEKYIRSQLWAMAMIPLAALVLLTLCAFALMQIDFRSFNKRYKFNYVFSRLLFWSIILFAIQLFGASIVYWEYLEIPNKLAFMSLISLIGPKLLGRTTDIKESDKKPWGKIIISMGFMLLTPLVLLYFTGYLVNFLMRPLQLVSIFGMTVGGLILLFLTKRCINVNKISLHNFYRDRLSRAYLIQHNAEPDTTLKWFQKIMHKDDLKLSNVYSGVNSTGPYHIINANLNLTKKMPGDDEEGIFRNRESFIFSKFWCGSQKTGYIPTADYENDDSHLDLGTAMAISGAAANIGMGQSNLPGFRLLMGLMNIRLGYWAPNPKHYISGKNGLKRCRTPGGSEAMKEWQGKYGLDDRFINLSDGGHFDNIGVYELLRRRCKYIIVGDAEADRDMKFQALAYIIRLARIDFGINIEIDLSDIKLDKDKDFSRRHAVVGTIEYPPRSDKDEPEVGYLLYCKSTITGDEPQHLHEYRIKNPSFPHQTTADQWFDEQQFEVYRELGYHVGKGTFGAVDEIKYDTNLEEVFIQLRQFWYPHSEAVEKNFTRHASEFNRIMALVKNDENLQFMDAQMFPEWETLMSHLPEPPKNILWLSYNKEEIRAGFYVCNLMIQLMENMYLDLNLEDMHDHPDNRGWMNLFMHWAWSGMFRVTWAISACTFGAKFQKFSEKRLKLDMGDIDITPITHQLDFEDVKIPNGTDTYKKLASHTEKELKKNLNLFEIMKINEFLHKYNNEPVACYSFRLKVINPLNSDECDPLNNDECNPMYTDLCNPLNSDECKKFGFGFALTDSENKIFYFRVQDHLRRMGLGRKALLRLMQIMVKESSKTKLSDISLADLELRVLSEMTFDKMTFEKKTFYKMLDSVITEMGS